MAHWKGFTIATGKAAWKTGAFLLKWGAKPAAKGTVWTIRKVAVDPAKNKVMDWSVIQAASNGAAKVAEMRARVQDGRCAQCGKQFNTRGGKADFCRTRCAETAALAYNVVDQVQAGEDTIKGNEKSLYLVCGCNRKNKFHGSGCTSNKSRERVAENVIWSNSNPEYFKPAEQPDHTPMTRHQAYRASAQASIDEAKKNKKWWQ